jgi:hypothetical protein
LVCKLLSDNQIRSLYQDSKNGLCSTRPDHDSAICPQLLLNILASPLKQTVRQNPITNDRDNLAMDLRIADDLQSAEPIKRPVPVAKGMHHNRSREEAVTGWAQITDHNMTTLLATEREATLGHGCSDLTISDIGANDRDPMGLQRPFKSKVTHDGGGERMARECIPARQVQSEKREKLVTIDDVA